MDVVCGVLNVLWLDIITKSLKVTTLSLGLSEELLLALPYLSFDLSSRSCRPTLESWDPRKGLSFSIFIPLPGITIGFTVLYLMIGFLDLAS